MNLYEVLKVDRSAGSREIYEAYLRRKTELESVGQSELSAEEKRKQLSDIEYARKELTDPAQRSEYDRGLLADETMNNFVPPRVGHRISLVKQPLEKRITEPEPNPLPKVSPSERQNDEKSPDEPSAVIKTDDVSLGRYLISNAIAFIALIILMIILF